MDSVDNSSNRIAETCLYQPILQENRRPRVMEEGRVFPQYLAAGAANLGILATGICMGWTSPTLPKLESIETTPLDHVISEDEKSWIGSLITVGAAIGPLYSGMACDLIGRKWTIILSGIPILIGWILVLTATSVGQLYAARIVWGLAVGQLFTAVPMYVGEIASNEVRGALGSFLQMFIVVGFLIAYGIGPYVSYTALCIIAMVPVVAFMIIFFFMPESPSFYIKKGKKTQATDSLQKLRGKSATGVQSELDEMQARQDVQDAMTSRISDIFTVVGNRKALVLACGLVAIQQLSGINVVLFYMQGIFEAAGTGLDVAVSTIIIGVVQVLASSVTPFVVDRLGRRLLLFISALGMTAALFFLGLFFILDAYHNPARDSLTWLPVASLVLFMCVYCVGFGPLPWAVIGELLDPSVKSNISTIATTFCWFIGFLMTKYFGAIGESIGMHYAFWIFAIFCLAGFFFVFFLLPETKGKSLQEIQDILNNRKTADENNKA